MEINISDIEQKELSREENGYDTYEVDEYIDEICDGIIELQDRIKTLQAGTNKGAAIMQKWEYTFYTLHEAADDITDEERSFGDLSSVLSDKRHVQLLGSQGWELIATYKKVSPIEGREVDCFVFKKTCYAIELCCKSGLYMRLNGTCGANGGCGPMQDTNPKQGRASWMPICSTARSAAYDSTVSSAGSGLICGT